MGKRDPFSKDSDGSGTSVKEEVIDFGETKVVSVGGRGGRTRLVAGVLVLGVVVGVGVYFLMTQNDDNGISVTDENAKRPKHIKAEHAKSPIEPATKLDMHAGKPELVATNSIPKPPVAPSVAPSMAPTMPPTSQVMPKAEAQNPPPPVSIDKSRPAKVLPTTTVAMQPEDVPESKALAHKALKTHTKMKAKEQGAEEEENVTAYSSVPNLMTPEDGAIRNYDETAGGASFTWSRAGTAWISFSANANMQPVAHKVRVKSNHYDYPHPHPGVWYWQVRTAKGKSKVRMFTINPPVKRSIALVNLQEGASLPKDNAMISWKGDNMITYYRVELSNQGWANPSYRFATTGTQLEMHGVPQGQYQIRVGAFSEISGRWEYTDPMKITVQ